MHCNDCRRASVPVGTALHGTLPSVGTAVCAGCTDKVLPTAEWPDKLHLLMLLLLIAVCRHAQLGAGPQGQP